jgi:hypothetical protein
LLESILMFFGHQLLWLAILTYALFQPWSNLWYLTNIFEDNDPLLGTEILKFCHWAPLLEQMEYCNKL